jgi:predicted TIM-barrel fold metal-dependent hydrolase
VIDGIPVIDAVVHPYNMLPSNVRHEQGQWITQQVAGGYQATSADAYRLPPEHFVDRDWSIEDVANMSFLEGYADLAAYHVLPIRAYHDGFCSLEKGLEAQERWPDRFVFYVAVDPMEKERALEELEEQVALFNGPVGLKLYPNSWTTGDTKGWLMDDPEVAFPVFQRARELGVKVIAIHKAIPLGRVEMEHYKVSDIDRAAIAFPDLNFEIVHGGMAFLEETAWQIARFPNVYVNLEVTATLVTARPAAFELAMQTLIRSSRSIDQIMWGTGCMVTHPRPHVENFVRRFQFSDRLVDGGTPQLTLEDKRKILAENYARLHGFDLASRLAAVREDSFAQRLGEMPADPYSTTALAGLVG